MAAEALPQATRLLDAHHHERTRPHAAGAAIVSVVTGQRRIARQVFAGWASRTGYAHAVATQRDPAALRRLLRAYEPRCALLFVPPGDDLDPALTAAHRLAKAEPQRPVAIAVTVPELEAALAQDSTVSPELKRLLIGGLVFADGQAQKRAANTLAHYRSDHENALHVLMRHSPDIGDLFRVNHRVRPQAGGPSYEVDFWAESLALALEVDGAQHAREAQRRRDDRRDRALAAAGIKTLRIHAATVICDPTSTLRQIAAVIGDRRKELERHGTRDRSH